MPRHQLPASITEKEYETLVKALVSYRDNMESLNESLDDLAMLQYMAQVDHLMAVLRIPTDLEMTTR